MVTLGSGRHLEVNLVDFSMSVIDNEQVTFRSNVVIGKTGRDFRTPEFSKDMTHMVINPFWHVPKSIAQREYLPMLKQDPMALAKRGLWLMNRRGQVLNTEGADFSGFSKGNFPFLIKQPPGGRNACRCISFITQPSWPRTGRLLTERTSISVTEGSLRRS